MNFVFFLIMVAGVVLLVMQQRGLLPASKSKGKLPPVERNIFNLEIGDIVQQNGIDWFVEGKLIYNIDAYSWFEYLLRDEDNIRWLSVEEDDLVEACIFEIVDFPNLPPTMPKRLNHEGTEYQLADSGAAKMMRLGNTLNRQEQNCHYYDYKSSTTLRLTVEIWGEDIEVCLGNKINPRSLNFLPGDGQKVYG